ncbi:MAG: RNA methyltransferase [Lachnospiraceae bacterium]|nr:RNA methyltransferase [Lachnospiraceae bacterium]
MVEGPRMVAEIPAEDLQEIFVSESFAAKHPEAVLRDSGSSSPDRDPLPFTRGASSPDRDPLPFTRGTSSPDRSPASHSRSVSPTVDVTVVSDDVFAKISDTKTPQGIAAVVRMRRYELADLTTGGPVLIIEDIQDPGTLGTMIRSAEGAGAGGIIMDPSTVDIYNPKVIRGTMGAFFRVPHVICPVSDAVAALKEAEYTIYAAHLAGQKSFTEVEYGKAAFMIGNEGRGLSDQSAALADTYIRIPMEGALESLNASVAASLLMYEWHRQVH